MLLFGEPGSLFNKIYWIDRLIFGSIIGAAITSTAYALHGYIKKSNDNKVLFPFQGIALTLILLVASTVVLFFVFK